MKKIALLYSYREIVQAEHRDAVRLFLQGPDNIGNLVYLTVLKELFSDIALVSSQDIVLRASEIAAEYATVLLPFSNMLSPYFSSGIVSPIIAKRVPITLFSIGIQVPLGANAEHMPISTDAEALLRYASTLDSPIGVRGAISQGVLQRYGIKSTVVGCPTFSAVNTLRRISGSAFTINATLSGYHRQLTSDILEFGRANNFTYGLQDETRIIADIYNFTRHDIINADSIYTARFKNLLFDYGYYNNDPATWEQTREWLHQRAFFKTTYHSWSSHLTKFDFAIGMRIHGNAIAMLSGVPALFVPCDQRTMELCQYHSLPFVEHVTADADPFALAAAVDYDEFFERQCDTKKTLSDFWESAHLTNYLKN